MAHREHHEQEVAALRRQLKEDGAEQVGSARAKGEWGGLWEVREGCRRRGCCTSWDGLTAAVPGSKQAAAGTEWAPKHGRRIVALTLPFLQANPCSWQRWSSSVLRRRPSCGRRGGSTRRRWAR